MKVKDLLKAVAYANSINPEADVIAMCYHEDGLTYNLFNTTDAILECEDDNLIIDITKI
jgi:hypothetical protein